MAEYNANYWLNEGLEYIEEVRLNIPFTHLKSLHSRYLVYQGLLKRIITMQEWILKDAKVIEESMAQEQIEEGEKENFQTPQLLRNLKFCDNANN